MVFREQGVRVSPSPTGLGVFSLRWFEVDEVLGPLLGTVVDDDDYESDYCMELGDHWALEPAPPFRFLNHSCHPNCALIEFEGQSRQVPELWLRIEETVAPGEQLTIDYAWPARSASPCDCGCADCRHWIVAKGELDQVQRRVAERARNATD